MKSDLLTKSYHGRGTASEVQAVTALRERSAQMREPQAPHTPQRRVGVYERLGRAGASPGKTIGVAVAILIILIVLIMALT